MDGSRFDGITRALAIGTKRHSSRTGSAVSSTPRLPYGGMSGKDQRWPVTRPPDYRIRRTLGGHRGCRTTLTLLPPPNGPPPTAGEGSRYLYLPHDAPAPG